jgi:hypothetical protein
MKRSALFMTLWLCASMMFAQQFFTKSQNGYNVNMSSDRSEMILNFEVGSYQLVDVEFDGVTYTTVQFESGINTFKKGYAELPMLNATVQLGEQNDVSLSVTEGEYVDIKLNHPMLPSRGTIYRNQDPKSIPYIIAPESKANAWYPENLAENAEPFIFRDTRGVNVYVYPFRYNAVQNTLRVYKSLKVGLKENSASSTNALKVKPQYIDPAINDTYKALYLNYSAEKFANQIGEFGEMLVIYTSRDATVIQPFIDWKRQMGFKVHTTQVATNTNVKTTIQNAYNSNPNLLYVQLVGDWADIKSDLGTGQNAPMDPMLGCVAGSDFYAELIIGRFSASTTAEVTVQVNKAINYEKTPDMSGTWYKNALGLARNEGAGSGDDSEGDDLHMQNIRTRLLTPSYNYSTVYQEYDGNSSYVTANTTSTLISSRINTGVSIINFANHGSETGWSVGSYSATHVNSLTNGSKLPVIFSVACVVGKFHRTTGDCFAETWLKKDGGGAVATIMSTINQPWIPPMRGQDYFNDILIGGYDYSTRPGNGTSTTASDKRTTFGSITFNGNVLMLAEQYTNTDTRETFQTWTIFGDASLQIRTNTPKAVTVSAGDVSGSPYSVTVTSNGTAVPNARVALFQNGVSFTAVTNSSGVASVSHNFTSGTAKLTVTAYNHGTYQIDKTVGSGGGTAPAVPTGLATSNIGQNSATLAWNAVGDATSYDVQIRPQGGSYSTYNVTSNSYAASGLNANTTYEWSVRAKNSYGTSNYTSNVSFTTQSAPTGATLPFAENFNASTLPTGWTTQNVGTSITERWNVNNTANAGGSAYEMRCAYQQVSPGTTRLITPAINTVGASQVTFSFRHQFDDYGAGATLRIQTSNDKSTWTNTTWSVASASNTTSAAALVNVTVTANLNSASTYFAFVVDGNLYQFDYWYVDNVSITAGSAATTPTVSTGSVSNVTASSVTAAGNVTADGGATVTERGIVYATTQNPTTANSKVASGTGTGSFTANITGLSASTTYYIRAYAINSVGTSYGSQVSFTSSASGGTASDVTIGTGTSTQGYPLNCYYGFERSASLYLASEVGAAGSIGKLGWYPTATRSTSIPVKIYIKQTTATAITASTWATMISGATLVYNGTMAGLTANTWKEFVLSTPFNFTGGSNNLLVLVETNYGGAGTGTSAGPAIRYTSATNRHMYVRADNSAPTGNGTVTSNRPNIKLTITRSRVVDSEMFTETTNEAVGMFENVNVYPNPTNGILTIENNSGVMAVEVYNMAGVKLLAKTNAEALSTMEINLSDYQNGIYLILVNDGISLHTMKVVKQ